MKKKGFTLIELLAVIVILAIIALIATPIILNIINDTRSESRVRSAEAVSHAVETAYLTSMMNVEANGAQASFTNNDVIRKTKIDNERSRVVDDEEKDPSITTKDGVTCSLSSAFVLACTYSDENVIEPKTISESATGNNTTTGFTGTIYRVSEEVAMNGASIAAGPGWCGIMQGEEGNRNTCNFGFGWATEQACNAFFQSMGASEGAYSCEAGSTPGLTEYSTSYENYLTSGRGAFLKHYVVNNTVEKSYACIMYEGLSEPVCVRGGDPSYYGNDDTGNVKIIKEIQESFEETFSDEEGSCSFNSEVSECISPSLEIFAESEVGDVSSFSSGVICYAHGDGDSSCEINE